MPAAALDPFSPEVLAGRLESFSQYLSPTDQQRLLAAFFFAAEAHTGQRRQSGEPYITHPLAVCEICCRWHLDVEALMAALLHDTVEDCDVSLETVSEQFGTTVSQLVDGLTKLDKVTFRNPEEAQAESFRKLILAMTQDVRVILIKLADRLHNMHTLDGVSPAKKRRVSRETLDIYAPIAHRLGLNEVFREFEDLCFAGLYPTRHRVLRRALKSARGNRKEIVGRLQAAVEEQLPLFGVKAEVSGREKSLYSIYLKMKEKRLSFAEVLDIYGFRVLVASVGECYLALGALHALFRPSPGRFKDYIALPKSNGYQSLHTVVIGPHGTPLEFQIRTPEMHRVAEAGVAAHWLYKESSEDGVTPMQRKAHEWMQTLLTARSQNPSEFFDHVKIDLFPDVVYVFTPRGEIRELPRGATPVDFAYTVHTDIGNRCVGALINGLSKPLDTELRTGDIVQIETREGAAPHPGWLGFVRTAKARSEIRHLLKSDSKERATSFGKRLLDQALRAIGATGLEDERLQWQTLLNESAADHREGVYESIGLGLTLAHVAARRLMPFSLKDVPASRRQLSDVAKAALLVAMEHLTQVEPGITLNGAEGTAVQYAACCHPIAGDTAIGFMRGGAGLLVHRASCPTAKRSRSKDPSRWAEVHWAETLHRQFEAHLAVELQDAPGVLAKIAAAISACEANIIDLTIEPRTTGISRMRVVVDVRDRRHLADVLRSIRHTGVVSKATRITRGVASDGARRMARPGL